MHSALPGHHLSYWLIVSGPLLLLLITTPDLTLLLTILLDIASLPSYMLCVLLVLACFPMGCKPPVCVIWLGVQAMA